MSPVPCMPPCPLAPSGQPGLLDAPKRPGAGDRAVVVGAGASGLAAARLLQSLGATVRLLDKNGVADERKAELDALGIELQVGEHKSAQFADADFVVPSPGVPLREILRAMGLPEEHPLEGGEGPAILAETELAFRFLDGEKVIAVTGTSGKTTTVHLAARMLEEAGMSVCLAGNVGTPLSSYVLAKNADPGAKKDVVVLEISSFQLQTCVTLRPDVAVLMNISPNHLDYHRDMDEYVAAKMRLFACQEACDKAVVPEEWLGEYERLSFRARPVSVRVQGLFPQTPLLGAHNALDCETAFEAVRGLGTDLESARRAVKNFKPLAHRLERVDEFSGVLFVNDSKSTTLESMRIALEAFERPVLLLCGGRFKGGDPNGLQELVKKKVRLVAGFGESENVFRPAFGSVVPVSWHATLEEACTELFRNSKPDDVILLSPGTASFDLYKGMAHRGEDFRCVVARLREGAAS